MHSYDVLIEKFGEEQVNRWKNTMVQLVDGTICAYADYMQERYS